MADTDFMPRRLDTAFSRLAFPESAKALIAMAGGNPAYNAWWDDFHGDSLDAKYPADVGSGTQVVGITAAVNGTMTAATQGNASGDGAGQGFGLHWDGDHGIYFIAHINVNSVTGAKYEIGLTDAVGDEGGAVDTKSGPTFTATDCAVFVMDTTEDAALTFVTNGGAVDGNSDWAGTFAASTDYIIEIVVQNDNASGYVNGQYVGGGNIEGGNPLTPWFFAEDVGSSATRTITVDYFGILGPRT